MKIKSVLKVIEQFNAWVSLLTNTRLKGQCDTYKIESKDTLGKGLTLHIALATIFEPLAKVIKGKYVKLLKWQNKFRLPKMWLEAPESRTHGLKDEDKERQGIELPKWTIEETYKEYYFAT